MSIPALTKAGPCGGPSVATVAASGPSTISTRLGLPPAGPGLDPSAPARPHPILTMAECLGPPPTGQVYVSELVTSRSMRRGDGAFSMTAFAA